MLIGIQEDILNALCRNVAEKSFTSLLHMNRVNSEFVNDLESTRLFVKKVDNLAQFFFTF